MNFWLYQTFTVSIMYLLFNNFPKISETWLSEVKFLLKPRCTAVLSRTWDWAIRKLELKNQMKGPCKFDPPWIQWSGSNVWCTSIRCDIDFLFPWDAQETEAGDKSSRIPFQWKYFCRQNVSKASVICGDSHNKWVSRWLIVNTIVNISPEQHLTRATNIGTLHQERDKDRNDFHRDLLTVQPIEFTIIHIMIW